MVWQYEQPAKMPTTTEIAAAIAVRYVDECGKPAKESGWKPWGELVNAIAGGLAFVAVGALMLWWGWTLALPVLQQYTSNLPTLTFGRIFGALLVLRSLRVTVYGGTVKPTYQLRLVK